MATGTAKSGKTSYVLCHQPQSFDWRAHEASLHPLKQLDSATFAQVCNLLNQIITLA